MLKLFSTLACVAFLSGCATGCNPNDPYEKFNRAAFKLNDSLDKAILKPAAQFYKGLVPAPVAKGVTNAFNNIALIPTVANDILQFDFCHASKDLTRFVFNSTFGIAGLFDVAKNVGLPHHYNDFGLTLARWGIKQSPYLVIPFFGPSTIRDGIALVPYYYMTVYPYIKPISLRYSILALYSVNLRANFLQPEELADVVAVDPYVFQRDAYLQNRQAQIQGGSGDKTADIYVEEKK